MKILKWLPYFILTAIVMISYHNAIEGDFVWDDEFLIEKNAFLRDFRTLPKMMVSSSTAGFGGHDNFYRPTQNIFYLFIFQFFGFNKVAFHIGNILLHWLNGVLFFLLALRLTRNNFVSLTAASLWLAHPTHVEAVTYISATADPLSTLFCLISLYLLPVENIIDHWKSYLASLFFFTLAILSKEAVVIMPGLVCLVVFQLTPPPRLRLTKYRISLPFWILAVFYLILRKTLLNFDQTFKFYKQTNIYTENIHYRLYTWLATLPKYLVILFRPTHLHMERHFPVFTRFFQGPVLLGTIICLSTLFLALYLFLKKGKTFSLFSWLWFFGAFLPMMGVLVPVNAFILEHWLYLPTFGFFLALSFGIEKSKIIHSKIPFVLIGTSLIALMALTIHRNKDWRTPIHFYTNILEYGKGTARIHNNLAMAYSSHQIWPKAIHHYLKAIEISDAYYQTHYNLARVYLQTNQLQKASQHLEKSLAFKPDFGPALNLKKNLTEGMNRKKTNQ